MGETRHLALFLRSLSGGGGAERALVTLAGAFAARGHRVDLVLGRARGAFLRDVPDAVRVVDLRGRPSPGSWGPLLRVPDAPRALLPMFASRRPPWILARAPALVEYLRRHAPDAMLSALNYTNLTALWAHRAAGVPTRLVVSERNTLSARAAHETARSLRALPSLARRFYPWADAIGAVSDGVADDLAAVAALPRAAIRTTGNPIAIDAVARAAREDPGHAWLRPGGPPVVLGAGKLRPQKGFVTLLEAFAALRRERPLRLVVLGEGPQRRVLLRRARALGVEADVDLPGFAANPFAFMARAAVFALSSAWEGLPGVLIQALACGCPVVSTDCPSGPSEILDKGRFGSLVPVGDARALAGALRRALDAPLPRERLRASAERYAVDRVASRYLELLLPEDAPACAESAAS